MYFRAYQKFLAILVCDDDMGKNEGRGRPVKRVSYNDCDLMQGTTFIDKKGREVFERDIVRVVYGGREFVEIVGSVPDMFGSLGLHPLDSVLKKQGIKGNPPNLDVEVLGNQYEHPHLLPEGVS